MAEWVRALACTGNRTVRDGLESHCGQLRFGTLAIPFPPPCGGDTKNRRYLLSGVYARGSKRSHQSTLECVGGLTVVDSTTHFKKNSPPPECDYAAENAALHLYRRKKKKRFCLDSKFAGQWHGAL